jgi:hypothetical protein
MTEPEVWARPATADEIPRGARAVVKAAEAAGWAVTVTYARGTYVFAKKPAAVVDSVLLRMAHGDRRAAAHWLDGGFDDAYVWSPAHTLRKLGVNNLKHALAETEWPDVPAPEPKTEPGRVVPLLHARPVVAGSWGTVHVGDVVRGADQRPWQVIERGPALRWVLGGDWADFTMTNADRGEVTARRKLTDPCDVLMRLNHADTAAAVGALVDGGFGVEILREHDATPEQQARATPPGADGCCGGWTGPGGMPEDCGDLCPLNKTCGPGCRFGAHVCGRAPEVAEQDTTYVHPDDVSSAPVPRRAERPCDDPFCGPGGCGWEPVQHVKPGATTPKERARTEERKPVGDEFQSAATPVRFDGYGRYILPDPVTGKERSWTRVSTVAKALADMSGLEKWKLRMVAKGLAIRPDLIAGAAAADPDHDKSDLQSIAKQALDAAESSKGANFGTALHNFTRRLDTGTPPEALHVPSALLSTVKAYVDCFRSAHLGVEHAERIVVLPDLGIAGEFDRIVTQPPGVTKSEPRSILDLKSGKDLSYGWLEIVIQQALYANAPLMWDPAAGTYVEKPAVDLARALILHLPVGQGRAQLYGVNIAEGWRLAQLALQVRAERSAAKKLAWLVTPDDPATVALHRVRTAASQADLATLWEQLNARNLWTADVDAAAHTRMAQLATV